MKIKIVKNQRLKDGDVYYDEIIEIETKKDVSVNIITKYYLEKPNPDKLMYLQIGNFLEKDFKEYEITEKDMLYIQE